MIRVGIDIYNLDAIQDAVSSAGKDAAYVIIKPGETSEHGRYWLGDYPIRVYNKDGVEIATS